MSLKLKRGRQRATELVVLEEPPSVHEATRPVNSGGRIDQWCDRLILSVVGDHKADESALRPAHRNPNASQEPGEVEKSTWRCRAAFTQPPAFISRITLFQSVMRAFRPSQDPTRTWGACWLMYDVSYAPLFDVGPKW